MLMFKTVSAIHRVSLAALARDHRPRRYPLRAVLPLVIAKPGTPVVLARIAAWRSIVAVRALPQGAATKNGPRRAEIQRCLLVGLPHRLHDSRSG